MLSNQEKARTDCSDKTSAKATYRAPQLVVFGTIGEFTASGSQPVTENGGVGGAVKKA